ncbi:hypothetical protein [Moorena producens]|uniref:hypothetical protein n=1 Tax=Moorena producens TaxID=1155739 RepID=UPI001314E0BD|nr:hypothetical protein [Moorena producens]
MQSLMGETPKTALHRYLRCRQLILFKGALLPLRIKFALIVAPKSTDCATRIS